MNGRSNSTRLGFSRIDFEAFAIERDTDRMKEIFGIVRPRLCRLGQELAPPIGERIGMKLYAHPATHRGITSSESRESWVAFASGARSYRGDPYLAMCISRAGVQARVIVGSRATRRDAMAAAVRDNALVLAVSFRGATIRRYDGCDARAMPPINRASQTFFATVADALDHTPRMLDVGFGWPPNDSIRLERAELIDAFAELAPLYRILRSAQ
jgi:uncharacterized protein YktB (UPF0637 family)